MRLAETAAAVAVALLLALILLDRLARWRHWRIGRLSWPFAGGTGACRHCKTTWAYARPHVTPYAPSRGVMVLCEKCYADLGTAEARYPFYVELMGEWRNVYAVAGMVEEKERVERAMTDVAFALRTGM